jgi:hypothetical protein
MQTTDSDLIFRNFLLTDSFTPTPRVPLLRNMSSMNRALLPSTSQHSGTSFDTIMHLKCQASGQQMNAMTSNLGSYGSWFQSPINAHANQLTGALGTHAAMPANTAAGDNAISQSDEKLAVDAILAMTPAENAHKPVKKLRAEPSGAGGIFPHQSPITVNSIGVAQYLALHRKAPSSKKNILVMQETTGMDVSECAKVLHPHLFSQVPRTTTRCKCKTTKCLKLYCSCFQGGFYCDPAVCVCQSCLNVDNTNDDARVAAITLALMRRDGAFEKRGPKVRLGMGCACKKSM